MRTSATAPANTFDLSTSAPRDGSRIISRFLGAVSLRNAAPLLATALVVTLLAGCTTAPERELSTQSPPNAVLPDGRDPLDPAQFKKSAAPVYTTEKDLIRYYEKVRGHALNILLLSGGGQNVAFGAGLLKGWRESGKRPEFDFVTGMSTGALLATHAFLGTPADDAVLEELFTQITADDIYRKEGLGVLGGSPSLLKTA